MFLTLDRLCERAATLSNHMRRYIRAVEQHREAVVDRLEEEGKLGQISYGDPAPDLGREMRVISDAAHDDDERLRFLAFYYALQYIIMEVRSLDILRYHLILERGELDDAYLRCISYAHRRFEELTSSYLGLLCEIVLPPELVDRCVVFGVGTMGDRDDIDVAAVDDLDPERRHELSQGLSRLSQLMLKTSCTLHFHMAEALASEHLSASVELYEQALQERHYSPVVISQLIGASPLVGGGALADEFVRRVPSRFYFHPGQENIDHEGFLRAMLGELKELVQRPVSAEYICPKDDGLRLIKGYLALAKSVHHVPAHDWGGILEFLLVRRTRFARELDKVRRALTFLEAVRYLHNLVIVEEEQIDTRNVQGSEALEIVADRMGFERRGGLSCAVPFLTTYYDVVDELKQAVGSLLEPLVDHLRQVTILTLDDVAAEDNLAIVHVERARTFFTTRYWDDLLDELGRRDSAAGERYVSDLARLAPSKRRAILRALVEWGVRDLASFGRFLILLRERARQLEVGWLVDEAVDVFLDRCQDEPAMAERLAELYSLWPVEVERFLAILDPSRLEIVQRLVSEPVRGESLAETAKTMARLVEVVRVASPSFVTHFRAAIQRHPKSLMLLREPTRLRVLAETLYGQAERFSDLFGRREWLEAYRHLETARLGLQFLAGTRYHTLLRQYRQGMHILLRSIYFLCRKELYALYHLEWSMRHSIAVYLDAGCFGFHPFDPNLTVLLLSFHEDEQIERFFTEVVASFDEELDRLGLSLRAFPDDRSGPVRPLRPARQLELLESSDSVRQDPLERLAVLRFSRIIGTRGHLRRFTDEVVEPLLRPVRSDLRFAMRERLDRLVSEVEGWNADEPVDPRLMPGGVRDMERLFLLLCADSGEPSLCDGRPACGLGDPGQREELWELTQHIAVLQVLATARRILRCDLPNGTIDAGFIRTHAEQLQRHPEVPDELFTDPAGYLRRMAMRNIDLMRRMLE